MTATWIEELREQPVDEDDCFDLPDEPVEVLCKHSAGPDCEECR